MSGKRSIALESAIAAEVEAPVLSLWEISTGGIREFLKRLLQVNTAVLTNLDDLDPNFVLALADMVSMLRHRPPDGQSRLWIITSKSPFKFADATFNLPDLSSDPQTHHDVCVNLLGDSTTDEDCPMLDILIQATRDLSMGELSALVRTAKTFSMSSPEPLSCAHLDRAFRALNLAVSAINLPARQSHSEHTCRFQSSTTDENSWEAFIGLTEASRTSIQDFQASKRNILLIRGSIGSGKTHLASAIVWNPTKPAARITSADILKAKIGETEKSLHKVLMEHDRLIIEDIDKLVPRDTSDNTGSIQRCLPVLLSFIDRLRRDGSLCNKQIVATARDPVHPAFEKRVLGIDLPDQLSLQAKVSLVKSVFPAYEETAMSGFDLMSLKTRSDCIDFGRRIKIDMLRERIQNR